MDVLDLKMFGIKRERCKAHHNIVHESDILGCINVSKRTVVARRVQWATGAAKRRGLLGRKTLPVDHGMYLVPCQWIHMFGMHFPIDVAFLAGDGRVLAVHQGLRPNRLSRPVLRAEGVLELAAGVLEASKTCVGDQLEWVDPSFEMTLHD